MRRDGCTHPARRVGALAATAALTITFGCHKGPEEPLAAADAAAPSSSGPTLTVGSVSATISAPTVPDAGDVDGGRAAQRSFCNDAFSADLDRMREKCAATDLGLMQSFGRAAANLCFSDLAAGLARRRADFDDDAAHRCVEMLRQKDLVQASENDSIFLHFPCDRVLLGLQGEGQACRFSIECKDGLACVGYQVGVDGTCRKPPKAKEACTPQPFGTVLTDAAAGLHHPACAPGAWCDGATCQPSLAAGKACSKSDACTTGLSCVMGKCGTRPGVGGVCAASVDCAFGLFCDRGATDAGAGKCAAKQPEGQACTANEACKGRCEIPKGSDGKPLGPGHCVAVCGSG